MKVVARFNPQANPGADNFFTPTLYIPFYLIFTNQSNYNLMIAIATDMNIYLGAKEKMAVLIDERMGYTPRTQIHWQADIIPPPQAGLANSYFIVQEAQVYEMQRVLEMPLNAF